jgi:hypothetical protein
MDTATASVSIAMVICGVRTAAQGRTAETELLQSHSCETALEGAEVGFVKAAYWGAMPAVNCANSVTCTPERLFCCTCAHLRSRQHQDLRTGLSRSMCACDQANRSCKYTVHMHLVVVTGRGRASSCASAVLQLCICCARTTRVGDQPGLPQHKILSHHHAAYRVCSRCVLR